MSQPVTRQILVIKFFCKKIYILSLLAGTITCGAFASHAQTSGAESNVSHVVIKGNQRIEPQTILSYLDIKEGSTFSGVDIDRALKNLYATGFFADASIYPENGLLVVEVQENPIVSRVAFEGNKRMEDKELEKETELKPRSIYTRTRVQNDVKRLLDIYRRSGRYSATIEPKIIKLDQNRVDVVFEISEGATATIQKINFVGNKAFSSAALEKIVRSERTRWYKFFSDNDKYDPDRLLYDQELLRRFYTSRGYADFQVKSAVAEINRKKDAFHVTYTVDEGRKYRFGDIAVQSVIAQKDAPDFKPFIKTKKGDEYNADQVEDTIDAITKELGNRGFAFVDIDPQLVRHPDTGLVDLSYTIKEGPRVYVERINITGNVRTLDTVVRREFRLAEGDAYSTSKLARTEQRLKNLGFFQSVKITSEQGSAPDRTVINVDVQEKSTGEISFGAGFSTQDGPLAEISVKESNLLGRGQDLRTRVLFSGQRQQYDIGFTEPYFLNREIAAGFDLFKTQQDLRRQSSFDRSTNGINLRASYALTEHWQHSANYTLKQTDITNVQADASRFVREQEGARTSSLVGQAFTYDSRDNKFDSTDGYYFKFGQEVAGLGGTARFIRHEVKSAYFYPVSKNWVLQLSGSAGYAQGIGQDVNIADRFFIGGDDLRGFKTFGIGPRDLETEDALGGNAYYTGTMEIRFPLGLPEDLGFYGAAFVDAGSLFDVDDVGVGVVDSGAIRVGAGLGIGWASPFGPIRLNFSHAAVKETYDETEFFRFSFGTRF